MSAFFASASSQRLLNTATPVTAYPISVGMWVKPTTTGTQRFLWYSGDTTASSYFVLMQLGTNVFSARVAAPAVDATAGTVSNKWFYIVARFVSSTNRQISVLSEDGVVSTGSEATSTTPTSVVNEALGASGATTGATFFDGNIAEFWITNTDIQPDGAALNTATLLQLARCGPFSIPNVSENVIDYRSLRYALGSNQDREPDNFGVRGLRQTWVNTNGVILGFHPPYLGPQYEGPNDVRRLGVV